jgi:hypothetical protein
LYWILRIFKGAKSFPPFFSYAAASGAEDCLTLDKVFLPKIEIIGHFPALSQEHCSPQK